MTPDTHKLAGDIFSQVIRLRAEHRQAFLDSACAANPDVRAEVLKLLEADEAAGKEEFLEQGGMEDAARCLALQAPLPVGPGTTFGNYRLTRQLGVGGMGLVFEAQDLRLGRKVAIKFLPWTIALKGRELVQRFQREARAASQLSHPNIVSIHDASFDGSNCYIAMELVEGRTLRQLIASGERLEPATIADILGQAASALNAAHEAGIIHRDIKPENIMLRPDGIVKVLDFGLAKLLETADREDLGALTRTGAIAGTLNYVSPEQVSCKPLTPASDLFSLGVVGYELATGVRPFSADSDYAVLDAILNRTPEAPSSLRPDLGHDLDALILQAMEKEPDRRFPSAGSMRSSCSQIAQIHNATRANSQAEGSQWHPKPNPTRWGVSRPRLLVAVFAALAITLTLAALWLARQQPLPRVAGIAQITGNGVNKHEFVTDGTRIFYVEGVRNSKITMYQASAKGGDPVPVPHLAGKIPLDISPDRSQILLGEIVDGESLTGPYPIWVADTLGNSLRRLGSLTGTEARWSPKGEEIAFTYKSELWLAGSDGSQARRITAAAGDVRWPSWSPDSRSIRFSVADNRKWKLWEVSAGGSNLRQVLPNWKDYSVEFGAWSHDGKYYVFAAGKGDDRDLWLLPHGSWLRRDQDPVRLTTGPVNASVIAFGAAGKRVLFDGTLETQELVRYDSRLSDWKSYLGGMPAMQLDFSRDGKWITYAHCPEASVYRSALDGSQRLQLTTPPFSAKNPRWSPDGSQIAFYGHWPGQPSRAYLVSAAGGPVQQLTSSETGSIEQGEPNWSPDGNTLIVGSTFSHEQNDPARIGLQSIDLPTRKVTRLPGSEGLWSPRWSFDGRFIATIGPADRLHLHDLRTHQSTKVTTGPVGWPSWSRDSQYVYFKNAHKEEWHRVRIKDGFTERVATTAGITLTGLSMGWIGLDFDGAPIATRSRGAREIYALDWDLP